MPIIFLDRQWKFGMDSIKKKICLYTGIATLSAVVLVTLFSVTANVELQQRSQQSTEELLIALFNAQLKAELESAARSVEEMLHVNFTIAEDLAENFSSLKVHSANNELLTSELRLIFNRILERSLLHQKSLLGTYTAWEPNALDGKDLLFAGLAERGYDASGRFIPYWSREKNGQLSLAPLADYENNSRPNGGDRIGEYYLCPRDTKQHCLINPYPYEVNGQTVLLTSIVSPIVIDKQFVGMAGVDISLEQLTKVVRELSGRLYQGQSEVMLITNQGTVAAHSADRGLGSHIRHILSEPGDELQLVHRSEFNLRESPDGTVLHAMVPIRVADDLPSWALRVSVPRSLVLAGMYSLNAQVEADQAIQTKISILIGAVTLIVSSFALWMIAHRIASPIQAISGFMLNVAKGDFTSRLVQEARAKDEIGELARACNQFLDQTQAVIQQVTSTSWELHKNAEDSTVIATQTLTGVQRQQSEVDQLVAAANEMSASAQTVADHAHQASSATQQTSAAASQGQEVLEGARLTISQLAEEVQLASTIITRLESGSQEIHSITDVIRDIADQTNLLALNAAIEAARAGEYGRGFAVVADEVRSLSLRTQSSTQDIYDMIGKLQDDAKQAVSAMMQGNESAAKCVESAESAAMEFVSIIDAVNALSDLNTQVASAAEQQSTVAEDINRSLSSISAVAAETAEGANRSNDSSRSLQTTSNSLRELVSHFRA
ncbi:methyl-accepting chemotaxis protein [Marinobacterium arenosum]|uniref:methyl-accepting chemotaxis protein n=1 Tax=Marinobacterium arenosum TaxID=2862496 RepID=UPI001C96FE7E|nr:methyl-accepting chemotaxis protein [Marinobacterium arenosum]MBY4677132.1 methyl-accepting chemotaxis protein [Marinobacterium arenosum]